MTREKIGNGLFGVGSYLFLAAVILFVWTRNHFYDFGVFTPTIKPSDVLLPIALLFFIAGWMLSRELRSNKERNILLAGALKLFGLFAILLGIGILWRMTALGLSLTKADICELGRILLGFIGLLLTLAFSFRDRRFAKLIFFAFFANVVLIPFLFMPIILIVKWLLVVSPVGYTFLGFQNSTIMLGFSIVITLTFMFAAYKFQENIGPKVLLFIACFLLVGLLFWTGSRAAWLAALVSLGAMVSITSWRNVKRMLMGLAEIVALFAIGFTILSPLIRNTAIVRVFPHLNLPTRVDSFLFFQLPTHQFIKTDKLIFDVGFRADRGLGWRIYSVNFLKNPLGVGPAYSAVFGVKNSYAQHVNAHDLWLQIAVSGGIGALALLIFLLYKLGGELSTMVRRRRDQFTVGLAGAFCGALIEATFIDSLEIRWLWVLLGLAFIWTYNEKHESRLRIVVE
jgi:hypothetical protein